MNYKLLKSYMAEFIFLIYILFICIFKVYNVSKFIDLINIIFFLILGIICYFLFSFSKCRKNTKKITLQTIIIWILIYYFITYMSGLVLGFLLGPYSFGKTGIIFNILPSIIIIVLQELVRYMYIRAKGNDYLKIAVFTVLFILFDLVMGFHNYNLGGLDGILKFIGLLVLPSISKQFLFSYLSYKASHVSVIVYRLLLETMVFILPIVPDLSVYLEAVIKSSFPIILFLSLDRNLEKYEKNKSNKKINRKRGYIYLPVGCVLIMLVVLVSGIFKYHMIAVATGSMKPAINIGDAVIIEKLDKRELSLLDKGDILAFNSGDKIVVHRIEEIILVEDSYQFITKGDANEAVDDYVVLEEDVIGTVNVKIPYIGLPSVWLRDMFK